MISTLTYDLKFRNMTIHLPAFITLKVYYCTLGSSVFYQCPGTQTRSSLTEGNQSPMQQQRPLLDIQQYQMMDSAVQPIALDPLVVMETER